MIPRRATAAALLGAALVAAAACGRFGNADAKADRQRRIISTAKQYTEILYALGADSDLVAVDVSSVYPAEAKKLPTVGYHRALSLEGMLSAKPTLILTSGPDNMGPEPVVRQLEALKIPVKMFTTRTSDIEGAKNLVREMGAYFHKEARADSLNAKLGADMARAMRAAAQRPDTPTVAIIHYGRAMNVYLTMTGKSVASQMVQWAGGRMALNDSGGMKQLTSPEVLAKANPDVILLTEFGYDRLAGPTDILALPGVAATKAARSGRIFRIEEQDLIYLGPRTGENVERLRTLIHQPGTLGTVATTP